MPFYNWLKERDSLPQSIVQGEPSLENWLECMMVFATEWQEKNLNIIIEFFKKRFYLITKQEIKADFS